MLQLKSHCQDFLKCISEDKSTVDVVNVLADEWSKVFNMESLLQTPSVLSSAQSTLLAISSAKSTGKLYKNIL